MMHIFLAAQEEALPSTTETLEILNQAQQNLQEMAENPGMIRAWLEGLLPDVINFAFQVLVALFLYFIGSKLIRILLKITRRSMERANADAGVRQFVLPLMKYTLYIILIFFIMGLFGIATTSAVALLGSVGVAIGLALQGSLSNLAGGVLILLLKPFRVGDYIIEDSHKNEGTVAEISIFYTKLQTLDNKLVIIPNGSLSNSSLTNVSNVEKRRVDVAVGIAYEADLKKAKEILYEIAEAETARLPEEEVSVFVNELGASAVEMGVRIWVKTADFWPARCRMMENVKLALDKNGISIPYQQIDVQIKNDRRD